MYIKLKRSFKFKIIIFFAKGKIKERNRGEVNNINVN